MDRGKARSRRERLRRASWGLENLPELRRLSLFELEVADLAPIAGLQALQSLDCSGTQVADLAPIAGLQALQSLYCSQTQVADLAPIAGLQALQSLYCSQTQVADLTPIAGLQALQSLDCSHTQVADLTPIAGLQALQSLNCAVTQVADLTPIAGLQALQSLNCAVTQVADLVPIAGLQALQSLSCSGTQVADLTPIAGLQALQSLSCSGTQVADLTPIAGLQALQSLICSGTQVADLTPIAGLQALRSLDCSYTPVADLTPIAGLQALQSLNCSGTQVADLTPIAGLQALQLLNCWVTQVADLTPIAGLQALQSLDCSYTPVADLTPIAGLQALQWLDCSQTQVADLTPIAGLQALQSLDCSACPVRDLGIALERRVHQIIVRNCRLASLPEAPETYERAFRLDLSNTRVPGLPGELFQPGGYQTDHAPGLAAHFRDLRDGHVSMARVKLIIVGNGRVGKTQLKRRLFDQPYDERVLTTHGVQVATRTIVTGEPRREVVLTVWDFGGQDIYHGSHGLFMRTRAIFAVCWTPELEDSLERDLMGLEYRNRPLPYWLDYVRHVAGTEVPVLAVQVRCDTPSAARPLAAPARERLELFAFSRPLAYSALNDRGRGALDSAIADAVDWMRDEYGDVLIGEGRLNVLHKLDELRREDESALDDRKRWRTLSREAFEDLCVEAGGVSSPDQLLVFLHNAGVVFHQKGLFDDRIILDQEWALEAIYAVFDREHCVRPLMGLGGRFTRPLLEALAWKKYSKAEQRLFISLMKSCGVIFTYREPWREDDDDTEYIAPDLLPARAAADDKIAALWNVDGEVSERRFDYAFIHDGFVRGLITAIGELAGADAVYWRWGVCAYEADSRSRMLFEVTQGDDSTGSLLVQTRSGQKAQLLEKMVKLIEGVERRFQVDRTGDSGDASERARSETLADTSADGEPKETPAKVLSFAAPPSDKPTIAISYAWKDASPEGRDREEAVDRFCREAEGKGFSILRDKARLGIGDDLLQFMTRITRSERVAIFLSDRYLKSPNCMFELYNTWRFQSSDPERFLATVRVFALPGANIWDVAGRLAYAVYWAEEFERVRAASKGRLELLGERDIAVFKRMQQFAMCVGDILDAITGVIQPRTFEDFVEQGLGD